MQRLPDDVLRETRNFAGWKGNEMGNVSKSLRVSTEAKERADCFRQSPACAGGLVNMKMGEECFGFCAEHQGYVFQRLLNMLCSGIMVNQKHVALQKLEIWIANQIGWRIKNTGANNSFVVESLVEQRSETTSNPGQLLSRFAEGMFDNHAEIRASYYLWDSGFAAGSGFAGLPDLRGYWGSAPIRFLQKDKLANYQVSLSETHFTLEQNTLLCVLRIS